MKSTALTFGSHTKPALTFALLASTGLMATTGVMAELGAPYYMALATYGAHIGRQVRLFYFFYAPHLFFDFSDVHGLVLDN